MYINETYQPMPAFRTRVQQEEKINEKSLSQEYKTQQDLFERPINYRPIIHNGTGNNTFVISPLFIPPSKTIQIIPPYSETIIKNPSEKASKLSIMFDPKIGLLPKCFQSSMLLQNGSSMVRTNPIIPASSHKILIPDSAVWRVFPPHSGWAVILPHELIMSSIAIDDAEYDGLLTWSSETVDKLLKDLNIQYVNPELIIEESYVNSNHYTRKLTKKQMMQIHANQSRIIHILKENITTLKANHTVMLQKIYNNNIIGPIFRTLLKKSSITEAHSIRYDEDEQQAWLTVQFNESRVLKYFQELNIAPSDSTIDRWATRFLSTLPPREYWTDPTQVSKIVEFWMKTFQIQQMNAIVAIDAMHLTARVVIQKKNTPDGIKAQLKGTLVDRTLTEYELQIFEKISDFYKFVETLEDNRLLSKAVFVVFLVPLSHKRPLPIHYHFKNTGNATEDEVNIVKNIMEEISANFPIKLYGRSQDGDPKYIEVEKAFYDEIMLQYNQHNSLINILRQLNPLDLVSADEQHVLKRLKNRIVNHEELLFLNNTSIQTHVLSQLINEHNIKEGALSKKSTDRMVDNLARLLFSPNVLINLLQNKNFGLAFVMIPGTLMRIA